MAGPSVRVQEELKQEAMTYARGLGISLNALVAVALREYLDARKLPAVLAPDPPPARQATPRATEAATPAEPAPPPARHGKASAAAAVRPQTRSQLPPAKRAGANAPCPCGSGQKTKRCHPEMCAR